MTSKPLVLVALYGLGEIIGNAGSDISVNFWISSFAEGAANFTILLLSAVFYVVLIVPVWAICYRLAQRRDPSVTGALVRNWLGDAKNRVLMVLLVASDVAVNVFGTYAAGHIPVLVQVVLKALEPLLCWMLSCIVWKGAYCRWSLLLIFPSCAVALAAGGVVMETWIMLRESSGSSKSYGTFWISMYCLRVVSSAVYNVVQGTLMRHNTTRIEKLVLINRDSLDDHVEPAGRQRVHAALLSLTVLLFDALGSLLVVLLVGPSIDTISYASWGSSSTVSDAWSNFGSGAACVGSLARCPNNLWYAIGTNAAWVVVYFVDTQLNECSPALNSLLNMLASPLTSLLLIACPALDLWDSARHGGESVALQVGGAVLMTISVVLFYHYEQRKDSIPRKEGSDDAESQNVDISPLMRINE